MRLSRQRADGTGGFENLSDANDVPQSWLPNGRSLAVVRQSSTTGADILVLDVDNQSTQPFANSAANETSPVFSPDGRWMVYVSDETGRREVYVRAYPGPEGKWQISSGGGVEPAWNRNGREVFYRSGSKMMSVTVQTEQGFAADQPHMLFEGRYRFAPYPTANYDVSLDGQRFLMLKPAEVPITDIHVVLNWINRVDDQLAASEK